MFTPASVLLKEADRVMAEIKVLEDKEDMERANYKWRENEDKVQMKKKAANAMPSTPHKQRMIEVVIIEKEMIMKRVGMQRLVEM